MVNSRLRVIPRFALLAGAIGMASEDMSRRSDLDLWYAAMKGSKKAFDILCSRRMRPLLWFLETGCESRGWPKEKAVNLAKETIELAGRRVRRMRNPPKDGHTWLLTLAREVLARHASSTKKQVAQRPDPLAEKACKYLEWLPDNKREILQRVLVRGQTVEAAGAEIGLSPKESQELYEQSLVHLSDFVETHH